MTPAIKALAETIATALKVFGLDDAVTDATDSELGIERLQIRSVVVSHYQFTPPNDWEEGDLQSPDVYLVCDNTTYVGEVVDSRPNLAAVLVLDCLLRPSENPQAGETKADMDKDAAKAV